MGIKDHYDEILRSMTCPGGASAERIDAAEVELGVVFPAAYRQFLARFGAAIGVGIEIAGLFESEGRDETPLWTDVVRATKRLRTVSAGRLAETLVFVSDDGMDVKYYLDTGLGPDGVVLAFGPGVDGKVVSHSFVDFLIRAAKSDLP